MKTVGMLATLMAAGGALVGTFVLVRSVPDIAHYVRLRKM
jgi:hypothetical protein